MKRITRWEIVACSIALTVSMVCIALFRRRIPPLRELAVGGAMFVAGFFTMLITLKQLVQKWRTHRRDRGDGNRAN